MARISLAAYGCKIVSCVFVVGMTLNILFGEVGNVPRNEANENETKESCDGIQRTRFNSSKLNLIINTYMRSGSTFLGKLFQIRPDTLYVFEPLWNAQTFAFYRGKRDLCHYNENRCARQGKDAVSNGVGKAVTSKESMAFLQSVLDCRFRDHKTFLPDPRHFPKDFPGETHSWVFGKGSQWKPYLTCADAPESNYKQCFSLMTPICKTTNHKVMKVLRSTLDNFETMLKTNKNLKMIHLFRDPRGILNSHLNTRFYQKKVQTYADIERDIKTLCDRMLYDIKIALRFRRLYTDRFKIVQYEDFGDPFRKAEILYNFMEMDLTSGIRSNLENMISKSKNSTHGFHPYNYRTSLPWKIERIANKHCEQVFEDLHYPVFKSEKEYKNIDDKPRSLPYAME